MASGLHSWCLLLSQSVPRRYSPPFGKLALGHTVVAGAAVEGVADVNDEEPVMHTRTSRQQLGLEWLLISGLVVLP